MESYSSPDIIMVIKWMRFLFTTASRTALGPTQPPYSISTGGSFRGDTAAGSWSWPLTSIYCRG